MKRIRCKVGLGQETGASASASAKRGKCRVLLWHTFHIFGDGIEAKWASLECEETSMPTGVSNMFMVGKSLEIITTEVDLDQKTAFSSNPSFRTEAHWKALGEFRSSLA